MVSITPQFAAASEDSIHRLSDADRESLDTARNGHVIGLDQDVDVIGLYAVVKHPEARVRSSAERSRHGPEHILAAKRRETASGTERDVDGTTPVVHRPTSVRYAAAAR
ncbi:MAG TPA: hypothetical protein VKU61_07870 [Candidatus Binatia bacterium]|nr:hypothetical protein [Candidatus Binatia bacterium]